MNAEQRAADLDDSIDLASLTRLRNDAGRRPQKTAALIAREIVQQISSRQLRPGDMLPAEREMLAEFGVGRGTLREALRFLEMHGVITIRPGPGGGPAVGTPDPRQLAGTLSMILQFVRTPFRSVIEAKNILEPQVAAAAARRATPELVGDLRESVKRLEANLGNQELFVAENSHFHDLIAWASGNLVFAYLLSSLHWINSSLGVQYPTWSRKGSLKAHRAICEAIARHDPQAAEAAMAAHNQEIQRYFEERWPGLLDEVVRWDRLA
jgi:DNA-binding FadR family transcriptional regulator